MGAYKAGKVAMNPIDWVHRVFVVWQTLGFKCCMYFAGQSHRIDKGTVGTVPIVDYGRAFGDELAVAVDCLCATGLADARNAKPA